MILRWLQGLDAIYCTLENLLLVWQIGNAQILSPTKVYLSNIGGTTAGPSVDLVYIHHTSTLNPLYTCICAEVYSGAYVYTVVYASQ